MDGPTRGARLRGETTGEEGIALTSTFTVEKARRFYDRFGRLQDTQAAYEDVATRQLIAHAALEEARAIVEFGCGTGRLAARLLQSHLRHTMRYLALDVSTTMVELARKRTARWAGRVEVRQTDGSPTIPVADRSVDRIISTYVLDLLSPNAIGVFVADAHRALTDDGRLCLVSITTGRTPAQRAVMGLFSTLHRINPSLVGGCRPVDLRPFIDDTQWNVLHDEVVSVCGITSQVLVAQPVWQRAR